MLRLPSSLIEVKIMAEPSNVFSLAVASLARDGVLAPTAWTQLQNAGAVLDALHEEQVRQPSVLQIMLDAHKAEADEALDRALADCAVRSKQALEKAREQDRATLDVERARLVATVAEQFWQVVRHTVERLIEGPLREPVMHALLLEGRRALSDMTLLKLRAHPSALPVLTKSAGYVFAPLVLPVTADSTLDEHEVAFDGESGTAVLNLQSALEILLPT
jgi:hypothetical protein